MSDQIQIVSVAFPVDLTCPRCDARTVRFTLRLPEPAPDTGWVTPTAECQCGTRIEFGSVPAEFTRE